MSPTVYLAYLGLAALVTLAPGPDFAVTIKNSLAGGRARGLATSLGITLSNVVQGTVAAFGIGLLLVRSQTVFTAIKWLGVAYLVYLGLQALRSAFAPRRRVEDDESDDASPSTEPVSTWRSFLQGFLSNVTNPKVLVFYLSVLPQFITGAQSSSGTLLLLAYSHAALALLWLLVLVLILHIARRTLAKPGPRRTLDGAAGVAMVGFAVGLAAESI